MIQVMIADDNLDLNNLCCNILSKDKDIQIISSTLDGNKVLIKANQITRNFYFEYKNKMLSVKLKGISNDKKWIFTLCRLLENI